MSIELSRQSERWLRVLIERTTDVIALLTCDGIITYASPATERVTGYTAAEVVGRNGFEFVHPQDLEHTTRQLAGILSQPGTSATVEFRYHHNNATWRWMEGTLTNLLDDPVVAALVCNNRDITERKQAEEERQQLLARERIARAEAEAARRRVEELNRQLEAEKDALRHAEQEAQARAAELEAVFEAMTEGVIVCDARGEIRYTNAAYRSLLALEEDTDPSLFLLDNRFAWMVVRDMEGRPLSKEQLATLRVVRGESLSGTHAIDLMCRTRKGEDLILSASGAPIRDLSGRIVGGVVVFRDVTRQRHMEQQLQYSERKLRTLEDSNILGMAVSDGSGRILEVNDCFAQLVGYSKDELLSGAVTKDHLIPADYRQALAHHEAILLATGAMPPWEKECLRKDGSRVPALMTGALLDRERGLALVLFHDISERKEVERRKQEFLSMVSHELRTPLTSIMGFLDLALLYHELLPRPLSPEAQPLLGKMETGLKRALAQAEVETRLVEELLDVARLETHKFELSLHPENLVTIVQEAVASQQQAAPTRHIELVLPPEEVVPLLADAGRVGQALSNYLTNALKYAPVEQPLAVCLDVTGTCARVAVRDQGPGLTPEQQQRVWERFYQVAAPGRQGSCAGLGLGLAIVKAIVEQHHGQVGVQSAPGQGSTFWFTLPIAISPAG